MRQLLLEKLNWRYAVKKFDPTKKIPAEDWKVLEESLRLSPSSFGLQPWKFFVIQDQALKDKLKAASWNQSQVSDCSHLVVILFKEKMDLEHIEKYAEKMSQVRGVPLESLDKMKASAVKTLIEGPRSKAIQQWAEKQTYIAMGMITAAAAVLGIDTCPMEGLEPDEYNKILGVEGTGWRCVTAIACGYRHPEDKYQFAKKVRFDRKDIFTDF